MNDKTEQSKTQPESPSNSLIASRVFDTPLLIQENKLQQILQVLGPHLHFDLQTPPPDMQYRTIEQAEQEMQKVAMDAGSRADYNSDGRYFVVGTAAIIPIIGTLVQRSSWLNALSGMTSYAQIDHSFAHAIENTTVEEVVFEIDSPGGEVAGCFALCDKIFAARSIKPITAIASEYAASAAYLIASAAETIVLPTTASVGSIGVVAAHFDRSKELEQRGVVVTFIFAGDKKIDGNPFEPLSERAQADWQEDIDTLYGMFAETVARNRNMSEKQVRSTEAGMFMGRMALDAGLADRVNTFANEVHNLSIRRGDDSRLTAITEEPTMKTITQEDHDTAVATARAEGVTEGREAAEAEFKEPLVELVKKTASDERTRISAIVGADEAKGREAFAGHLALETDMEAEQAVVMLSKSPVGNSKSQLALAMEQLGSPEIPSQETLEAPTGEVGLNTIAIYAELNKGYNSDLNS